MDLDRFSQRMGQLGEQAAENADELVRKVAMAIDQTVVMATPVNEGRARANWIASLDAPALGEVETFSVGAAQKAIDDAASVIAGYDGDVNSEINISNNVPYIGRLNDGWSAQAPAGFVSIAVGEGVRAIDGAKILS